MPSAYSQCREVPNDISIAELTNRQAQNILGLCPDVFRRNNLDPDEAESIVITEPLADGPVTLDNVCYEDGWFSLSDGKYRINGQDDIVDIDRGHQDLQEAARQCFVELGVETWPRWLTHYFGHSSEELSTILEHASSVFAEPYICGIRNALHVIASIDNEDAAALQARVNAVFDGVAMVFEELNAEIISEDRARTVSLVGPQF